MRWCKVQREGKTRKQHPITHTPPHDPINQACLEHCNFYHVDRVFIIPNVNVHVVTCWFPLQGGALKCCTMWCPFTDSLIVLNGNSDHGFYFIYPFIHLFRINNTYHIIVNVVMVYPMAKGN